MKKLLVSIISLIVIVAIIGVVVPMIYKDEIVSLVKKEINNNVDATVDFKQVNLSLFKSFPHFNLEIEEFTVVGKREFEFDTLTKVRSFNVTLDLLSVINGESIKILAVNIDNPQINVHILKNGKANFDIALAIEPIPGTQPQQENTDVESDFVVDLQKVSISNGSLSYLDESLNMFASLDGLNHTLKGDLSLKETLLQTSTKVKEFTFSFDGEKYFNRVALDLDVDINADLDDFLFEFSHNRIVINEIPLVAEGSFQMLDDSYKMDIQYHLLKNKFKPLLSMIPAEYLKDYETVKTDGSLKIDGFVKGEFSDSKMPVYALSLKVENAYVAYPDMPEEVKNINIDLEINNPDGVTDHLKMDLPVMSFDIAGNTFSLSGKLRTPMSDPFVDFKAKGDIDLASVSKLIPLEEKIDLSGSVNVDISLKGNLSAIENEEYNKFEALGYLAVKNVEYSDLDFPISIRRAQFNFSPEYVDMTAFDASFGKSNLFASGHLENLLAYALQSKTLHGNLNVKSDKLDVNEFMPAADAETVSEPASTQSQSTTTTETTQETSIEPIIIPKNIDFNMSTVIGKIIYDDMIIDDFKGDVTIKDGKLIMHDVEMNTLGGDMVANGSYYASEKANPKVSFNLKMTDISVKQASNTFVTIQSLAPIVSKANGDCSVVFDYKSELDNNMDPVLSSVNGKGDFSASMLSFGDVEIFNKLGKALKIKELQNMVIENVAISFVIRDGNLFVKPFDFSMNNMKATLGGRTGLDKSIDYDLILQIPRKKFGSKANTAFENVLSKASSLGISINVGDNIDMKAKITGTLSKPKVSVGMAETVNDLKNRLSKKLDKQLEEKKKQAKLELQKKADKILADARNKSEKIIASAKKQSKNIKKEADKAAAKIISEAKKQGEDFVKEASEKGMLAKLAAQKTADKLNKVAKQKADDVKAIADKNADKIVVLAKKETDEIMKEAKKQSDAVL